MSIKFFSFYLPACFLYSMQAFGQGYPIQKSASRDAGFIIKVQSGPSADRSAEFIDRINAVPGLSVESLCHSPNKPQWYVKVALDKQVQPDLQAALEQLAQHQVSFKRLDWPAADFNLLCGPLKP